MSLRKRCSQDTLLPNGDPNPLVCPPSPRCEHYWHYDFRVNSRRYRASCETADKHKARDYEAKERTRILDGKHGIRRQPDITFKEFAREYVRVHGVPNKKASTVDRDDDMLRAHILPAFGDMLLRDITSFGLEQYKAKRLAAGRAAGTVNRELMLVKGILTKAVEWKRLTASPGADVRPVKGRGQRTRILTTDEQQRLLAAYDKGRRRHVKPIIELLLITGARLGEVLSLRWQDCQSGYLRFVETKSGKPRRLPMTAAMIDTIAKVPKRDQNFVFVSGRKGGRYTRILTGFRAALKDAAIANPGTVVIHTLRHTALSRMMEAGMDVRTIMEISGHSSLSMLERYTHPTEQRKTDALDTYQGVAAQFSRPSDITKAAS